MKNSPNYLFLIVLLSVAIGFLIGSKEELFFGIQSSEYKSIRKLTQLMEYLSEDYVEKINTDSLVGSVIKNVIEKLDPHSVYIPAKERLAIAESMQGNYVGIGISFFIINDSIAVVRVLEGGSSEKAGIKTGDRILMADQDTLYQKNLSAEAVVSRLRGKSNTPVNLRVYRKTDDSIYNFKIRRGAVPLPSVSARYMINDQTGYLKINRFSQTTFQEFQKAMRDLLEQNMQNLILDLRGNPGGYLLPAKQISDAFLSEGNSIVIVESDNGEREQTIASAGGLFEEGVLYILVDEQSASASEIVAGAVQDNDRGWIVGRRTYGKGLVQQQLPLGEGDLVQLTVARYYTPTGRSIQRPYSKENDDYHAEILSRFETGEMSDISNIPVVDSLEFITPKGHVVYGGGGIAPDIYIPNKNTLEEEQNNAIIHSNFVNRFVFLELDKKRNHYEPRNAEQFYNEPLPDAHFFLKEFENYCEVNGFPMEIKEQKIVVNAIKAYIGLQTHGEELFIKILNQEDLFVKRTLDEIEKN